MSRLFRRVPCLILASSLLWSSATSARDWGPIGEWVIAEIDGDKCAIGDGGRG